MFRVQTPRDMNAAFASAFNSRRIENLVGLYEPDALLRTDSGEATLTGHVQIGEALQGLLALPGTMVSLNNLAGEIVGGQRNLLVDKTATQIATDVLVGWSRSNTRRESVAVSDRTKAVMQLPGRRTLSVADDRPSPPG